MRFSTPLPEEIRDRAFRVEEALALGVTRKRLRGVDLRAPFYGVRVPLSVPWGVRARARAALLVLPEGSLVVGLHAVAVAGLPAPMSWDDLVERPLEVAVPLRLREPRPRRNLDVGVLPWRTRCRTVVDDGVPRPADEDLWAHVVGAGTPRLSPDGVLELGRAVLERGGGDPSAMREALGRVPPAIATRARLHLARLERTKSAGRP
ncbi:hypothetical protein [Quadrisphaera sp. KR29]|uniref:hypothetical protein n=1 Tax=Quadrisphaera sp. KR29 TaxID=3461391 RepID=UPI004044F98A